MLKINNLNKKKEIKTKKVKKFEILIKKLNKIFAQREDYLNLISYRNPRNLKTDINNIDLFFNGNQIRIWLFFKKLSIDKNFYNVKNALKFLKKLRVL